MNRRFVTILCAFASAASCLPRGDLDGAARGSGMNAGQPPASMAGAGTSPGVAGSTVAMAGSASIAGGDASGAGGTSSFTDPITADTTSAGSTSSMASAAGDASGGAPARPITLQDLPMDLPDSPVSGGVTATGDAVWEVAGTQEPTFEVRTPTASYWLVKSLGEIVSITDMAGSEARQWIGFSSFRPARGFPSYASLGNSPQFTTVLDADSQTPHHVRLRSETAARDLQLVWDFYLTHLTLTVEAAPAWFQVCYRGAPAGSLDADGSLLLSDGTNHDVMGFWNMDFPGNPEWIALTDADLNRGLYLIQHADDPVADRYQVKDNDTAFVLFGRGPASVPRRFSLGLLDSASSSNLQSRVQFVDAAMR